MKKLFVFISILLFALPAIAMNGPIGRSTSLAFDGSIKDGVVPQYYENYINRDGASAAAGSVMCLSLIEDDGASIVSCPAAAGGTPICVLSIACADDKACKCQYWGLNASVLFDSTNAGATAGQAMYVSENNAGYGQATVFGSVVATDVPIGVFYDSASASAAVEIFLKL